MDGTPRRRAGILREKLKGKLVPVHEVGWDDANATPTHVLMMASSSCGEAYVGSEGLTLYIDNISFGF